MRLKGIIQVLHRNIYLHTNISLHTIFVLFCKYQERVIHTAYLIASLTILSLGEYGTNGNHSTGKFLILLSHDVFDVCLKMAFFICFDTKELVLVLRFWYLLLLKVSTRRVSKTDLLVQTSYPINEVAHCFSEKVWNNE